MIFLLKKVRMDSKFTTPLWHLINSWWISNRRKCSQLNFSSAESHYTWDRLSRPDALHVLAICMNVEHHVAHFNLSLSLFSVFFFDPIFLLRLHSHVLSTNVLFMFLFSPSTYLFSCHCTMKLFHIESYMVAQDLILWSSIVGLKWIINTMCRLYWLKPRG